MIGVSSEYPAFVQAHLQKELEHPVMVFHPNDDLSQELLNCKALLIRSGFSLPKKRLELFKNLKFVVTATSGFDHIDINWCKENSVTACYTPTANVQSVVELTTYFLIESQRRLQKFTRTLQKGHWKGQQPKTHEVFDKSLGIIGLGKIGQRVAQVAKALGMRVTAHDPYQPAHIFEDLNVEPLGLTEILRSSDIVSLHVPLTSETYQMINERTLEYITDNTYLINTSRGKVLKEHIVLEALNSQHLAGLALDVFSSEPLTPDHPLRNHPNVISSPHIGAYTEEAFRRSSQLALEKTVAFFKQQRLTDTLPPADAWYIPETSKPKRSMS